MYKSALSLKTLSVKFYSRRGVTPAVGGRDTWPHFDGRGCPIIGVNPSIIGWVVFNAFEYLYLISESLTSNLTFRHLLKRFHINQLWKDFIRKISWKKWGRCFHSIKRLIASIFLLTEYLTHLLCYRGSASSWNLDKSDASP